MRIMSSLHFDFVDSSTVTKIIDSLKTKYSAGHDGISLKFLKIVASAIINPLTLIINQSLATGIFPDSLKIAKVIPLYKQGKSEGFESCDRPIVGKRPIWVKIGAVLSRVTLIFDGWPWKTIGHLSFAVSSFVQHFIAIGEFKLELQSANAQSGSKIFEPCDLEIWRMTLKNNRAPLLSIIKLYASFHHHMWI